MNKFLSNEHVCKALKALSRKFLIEVDRKLNNAMNIQV
jgi:hypothetical protein